MPYHSFDRIAKSANFNYQGKSRMKKLALEFKSPAKVTSSTANLLI